VLEGATVNEVVVRVPNLDMVVRFGVTRQAVHVWLRRYAAVGAAVNLEDRSSRPHGSSTTTKKLSPPLLSCPTPSPGSTPAASRSNESLLSDNGSAYISHAWRDAWAELGVVHKRTRPYRPQTNGKIERFHRTLAAGWAFKKETAADGHGTGSHDEDPAPMSQACRTWCRNERFHGPLSTASCNPHD